MNTEYDNIIQKALQRDIKIELNGKIIRRGKLLLYVVSDLFVNFTLQYNDKMKKYDIMYPYNIEDTGTKIIFDYRIDSLSHINTGVTSEIMKLSNKADGLSRFFNNKIDLVYA